MTYEPALASIKTHPIPQWYNDAKFGIFIHWGLFSVPGWAYSEKGVNIQNLQEDETTNPFGWQKVNPYAEWYQNSLRIDGSPTQEYHKKAFGQDFRYEDFQKPFEEQSSQMDPTAWAKLFREAGAKYVVLVTKHHDGYCLWPTTTMNPMAPGYHSKRDLVGELTEAVRAEGLKMGLYYSGIFDWTFKKQPMDGPSKWLDHYLSSPEYAEYSEKQTRELIERYHPSVLWNDMGYPGQADIDALIAWYYNTCPDGVTNERWIQRHLPEGKTVEEYAAELLQAGVLKDLSDGMHGDFMDPEYQDVDEIPERKWESCRGIGMSFGYNVNENASNFMTGKDIIYFLADTVSKNGNLLLNVGPRADGSIQEEQVRPLLETGAWLDRNGEAIYKTICRRAGFGTVTSEGKKVCFTVNGNSEYAIVLDEAPAAEVTIKNLSVSEGSRITLLGSRQECQWSVSDGDITIVLPSDLPEEPAYTFKIEK